MKKYKVKLTSIEYKGKKYKPGSIIELEDKDAADLIKNDFVREVKSLSLEKKTPEELAKEERIKELDEHTIPELKEMAADMELQLEVTKKADIIKAIMEAEDKL